MHRLNQRFQSQISFFLLGIFFLAVTANAGTRAQHWSGFDVGFGASPFPSVGGGMLGFNIGDDARISAGSGIFASGSTGSYGVYGADVKFFTSPEEWSFYFGAGLNFMSGTKGSVLFWDFKFTQSFVPYLQLGADFQSDLGLHLGFNLGAAIPDGQILVMPGIAFGWYF